MSVDQAIAEIPAGWILTLDHYLMSDEPELSEYTWRAWLRKLAGDLDGDGPCYVLKAFGTGKTPADAIHAAICATVTTQERAGEKP